DWVELRLTQMAKSVQGLSQEQAILQGIPVRVADLENAQTRLIQRVSSIEGRVASSSAAVAPSAPSRSEHGSLGARIGYISAVDWSRLSMRDRAEVRSYIYARQLGWGWL